MAFNFFGFKKRHDIEDVVPKEEVPTLPPQEDLKALDTASVAPVVEPEVATQDVSALPKEIEPPIANELSSRP